MSNLYIRLKTGFFSNLKTLRLHARIGDDAFWIPPRLWAYAAENKPDGDFSSFTTEEIASLLGCVKYAPSIRQALVYAGFLDADGKIHAWQEHNGYHDKFAARARIAALAMHAKRRAGKEKKQKKTTEKEIGKGKEEQAGTSTATSSENPATSTKAKGIEADVVAYCIEQGLPESDGHWFFNKCEASGWTVNGRLLKDWRAQVRCWKGARYMSSQKNGNDKQLTESKPNYAGGF